MLRHIGVCCGILGVCGFGMFGTRKLEGITPQASLLLAPAKGFGFQPRLLVQRDALTRFLYVMFFSKLLFVW